MSQWIFQTTTLQPQFDGQPAERDLGGRPYYRHKYLEEAKALAVFRRSAGRAEIWAYKPGVASGGHTVAQR